jgi:hypothetical protein
MLDGDEGTGAANAERPPLRADWEDEGRSSEGDSCKSAARFIPSEVVVGEGRRDAARVLLVG